MDQDGSEYVSFDPLMTSQDSYAALSQLDDDLEPSHTYQQLRPLATYREGYFPVTVSSVKTSEPLSLVGSYILQVASSSLVLWDTVSSEALYEWPFTTIRRYGSNPRTFTFECGRKSRTGEGTFQFFTYQGGEIRKLLENKLATFKSQKLELTGPGKGGHKASGTDTAAADSQPAGCSMSQQSDYLTLGLLLDEEKK